MATDVDMRGFLAALNKAGKDGLRAAEQAMAESGIALLDDAVMELPTTPLKTGTLRGSGSVLVNGEFKHMMTPEPGANSSPATRSEGGRSGEIVGEVGFNTPYAARLHEHPEFDFKEPGSGGKWLERPLFQNADDYFAVLASGFTRRMKAWSR